MVLGVARHSETEEELVVYRRKYGDRSLGCDHGKCSKNWSKLGDGQGLGFNTLEVKNER